MNFQCMGYDLLLLPGYVFAYNLKNNCQKRTKIYFGCISNMFIRMQTIKIFPFIIFKNCIINCITLFIHKREKIAVLHIKKIFDKYLIHLRSSIVKRNFHHLLHSNVSVPQSRLYFYCN